MKKILLLCVFLIMIFPDKIMAKKITCNNGEYNVTVEVENDKININKSILIAINSEYNYQAKFKSQDENIVVTHESGYIKGIKEGNTNILVDINFLEDNDLVGTCHIDLPIEVTSSDNTLKLLNIEEFDISDMFDKDVLEYNIIIPYNIEKINIIAEPTNEYAKVTGDGRRYLNEGKNEYDIIVTATDNSTRTYKINISRMEASDDSSLQNLIVEGYILDPTFDKNTYTYNLSISEEVHSINIKAIPTNEYATIKGTGTHTIASGENTYYINVVAENNTSSTYKIIINKNKGTSRLKSIEIEGFKLEEKFDSDKYIYHLTVGSNIDSLIINSEAFDKDKVDVIGNEKLEYGENEIFLRVTSKDKSNTTYKLIVYKLSREEEKIKEKNNRLLRVLLTMFIIAIIFMSITISIYLKRNLKNNVKKKRKLKKNYS